MIEIFSQDFKDVEALWVLGFIADESFPEWADRMLDEGIQSEALIDLATSPTHQIEHNRDKFFAIVRGEREHEMPKPIALARLGRLLSQRILTKQIAPLDAANIIWSATVKRPVNYFHDLDPFIYAASEAANRPQERQFFEDAVVHEAARFLESHKDA